MTKSKEILSTSSEIIQSLLLVATFITNIILNYIPYDESKYSYERVGKNYYAIKASVLEVNYSTCTNLSQYEFDQIMSFKDSQMGSFVRAQYWICFLVIGGLQIFAWYNRTNKKITNKTFKIILVCVKIFFAPSIFAVSIIDYKSPCIYIGVGTFFIYVASFANLSLFIVFFCIFFIDNKSNDVQYAILAVFGIYMILALVIYVGIYFGPIFTKLENGMMSLNMILDGISSMID